MARRPRNLHQTMETTTAFDLNQTIQRWRENLAHSPVLRSEDLAELESHLRDSVAGLQACGLTTDEAFLVASRRIGKADSLETEFGKVNHGTLWLDRVLWMLIGLQLWQLVWGAIGMTSYGVATMGLVAGSFDFATHGLTLPVVLFTSVRLLALLGSLAICWWVIRRGQSLALRIEGLLDGRAKLVAIFGVLCLISWAVSALGGASWPLVMKFANPQIMGEVITSQNYAGMFTYYIQTGALILLTLILARKRLQLKKA